MLRGCAHLPALCHCISNVLSDDAAEIVCVVNKCERIIFYHSKHYLFYLILSLVLVTGVGNVNALFYNSETLNEHANREFHLST